MVFAMSLTAIVSVALVLVAAVLFAVIKCRDVMRGVRAAERETQTVAFTEEAWRRQGLRGTDSPLYR